METFNEIRFDLESHGKAQRFDVFDAPLKEGQTVELVYPSSKTGEPIPRIGRVEKVADHFIVVEVAPKEYRTFRKAKVVGLTINVWNDTE